MKAQTEKIMQDIINALKGKKTTILVIVIALLTAWAGNAADGSWIVENAKWIITALAALAGGTAAAKLSRPRSE